MRKQHLKVEFFQNQICLYSGIRTNIFPEFIATLCVATLFKKTNGEIESTLHIAGPTAWSVPATLRKDFVDGLGCYWHWTLP